MNQPNAILFHVCVTEWLYNSVTVNETLAYAIKGTEINQPNSLTRSCHGALQQNASSLFPVKERAAESAGGRTGSTRLWRGPKEPRIRAVGAEATQTAGASMQTSVTMPRPSNV